MRLIHRTSDDTETAERVKASCCSLATYYFIEAKGSRGHPLDPVARFHLGNGAQLERLNFLGDRSEKGMQQSHGLMVNYLYALDKIEANHEAFAEKGQVATSSAVRKMLPVRALAEIPASA